MDQNSRHLSLLAFVSLGIVWGSNFIYMKMAAQLISASQMVLLRVLFGLIPVLGYAWYKKAIRLSQLRHAHHFFAMSVLATAFYYWCFAKGSGLLLSGIAGAVSGIAPLLAFVMAVAFISEERATPKKICGVFIGLAGVVLVARPTGAEIASSNLEGVIYMVLGSLSVGGSFVYARKYVIPLHLPGAALTAWQLAFGFLILALITPYEGMGNLFTDTHATLGLIIGLGLLGTGLAYILYYFIVETMGAVSASSVSYIPPVVALIIGFLIAGEPIGTLDFIATGLIFLGVILLKQSRG